MSVRRRDLTEKWYEYVYRQRSERVRRFVEAFPDERSLSISYDRFGHDYQFARPLLANPDEVLRAGRAALGRFSGGDDDLDGVYLRVTDLPEHSELSLAELGADHLNELQTVRCTVASTDEVRPKVVVAAFRCAKCDRITRRVPQQGRAFRDHAKCPRCSSVGYLSFAPEDSEYVDAQSVAVGELSRSRDDGALDGETVDPEAVASDGGDERPVTVFLEDDLAGTVDPGDDLRLVAIPRATRSGDSTVADRWLEAVSMEHLTDPNR